MNRTSWGSGFNPHPDFGARNFQSGHPALNRVPNPGPATERRHPKPETLNQPPDLKDNPGGTRQISCRAVITSSSAQFRLQALWQSLTWAADPENPHINPTPKSHTTWTTSFTPGTRNSDTNPLNLTPAIVLQTPLSDPQTLLPHSLNHIFEFPVQFVLLLLQHLAWVESWNVWHVLLSVWYDGLVA